MIVLWVVIVLGIVALVVTIVGVLWCLKGLREWRELGR